MKDYYKILQVHRSANAEEIKRAYRKQAMLFHPDVNKSLEATTVFASINEAYTILSHFESKRKYDTLLHYGATSYTFNQEKGPKTDPRYSEGKGRKYGTAYKYGNERPPRTQHSQGFSEADKNQLSMVEDTMFFSLLLIGIFSLFLSLKDLIYNQWDGINSFTGLIFSMSFVSLLLYFWSLFKKR